MSDKKRPHRVRCRDCGKLFPIARVGKIPERCPDCRVAWNIRMTVQRDRARKEKRRHRGEDTPRKKTEKQAKKPAAGYVPPCQRSDLGAAVHELCLENARREQRGEKVLSYGQWMLLQQKKR